MDESAGDLSARGAQAVLERFAVLLGEKTLLEAYVDVIPREASTHRQRPEHRVGVDSGFGEGLFPRVELELFLPRVEARAPAPRALDDVRESMVAAREDAFEPAARGVVNAQRDLGHARLASKDLLLS